MLQQEEYEQLNNIYGRYVHYKSQIKSSRRKVKITISVLIIKISTLLLFGSKQ